MSGATDTNQATPEKDASISTAIKQMKHNRPLRAEETCRDYLLRHPGCTDHMRMLGHALMKQQRYTEAEEQFRFALAISPDFPQLHEDLGSTLALQSRFEDAVPAFEKALRLQPALPLVQKKLGNALAAMGRGEEADEAYREYIDSDPDRAAIIQGVEHQREGRFEEAVTAFQEVLRRNPKSVNAMRHLAVVYWQQEKRTEDAEALLLDHGLLASGFRQTHGRHFSVRKSDRT
jgi:tetratricopeptide (TPR) repeat protein